MSISNLNKEKEFKNFAQYVLKHKNHIFPSLNFLTKNIFQRIGRSFFKRESNNYPSRASIILAFNGAYSPHNCIRLKQAPRLGFSFTYKTPIFEHDASSSFSWLEINKGLITDSEVLHSAHRWYWLLYDDDIMRQYSINERVILVKHWLSSFPYKVDKLEWDSY